MRGHGMLFLVLLCTYMTETSSTPLLLLFCLACSSNLEWYDALSALFGGLHRPSRQALTDDNDKGGKPLGFLHTVERLRYVVVSFRFPGGIGGSVVCQAHNDHQVGLADNGKWRTDVCLLC